MEMEIISRKGGGLPRNYAENSSWLNPSPWRAVQSARAALVESLRQSAATTEPPAESAPVQPLKLTRRERRMFARR